MKTEIVWLEDPLQFTYLREMTYLTTKPRQFRINSPIVNGQAKLVGYEIITLERNEKHPQTYSRRFWVLKKHDRDIDPDGVYKDRYPTEAVIPASIGSDSGSERYRG